MILYGHASETAIHAVVYLAMRPPGRLIPVQQVARDMGLPGAYLAKIVPLLIRAGLVRAARGPGGGVGLARPPEEVPLWSVVRAVEGPAPPERCALGLGGCSPDRPCALHPQWSVLRAQMQRLLEATTLAAVARGLAKARAGNGGVRRRRVGGHGLSH